MIKLRCWQCRGTSIRVEGFKCRSARPTGRSTDISPPDFVEIGETVEGGIVHGHDEHEEFEDKQEELDVKITEAGAPFPPLGFLGLMT